MRSAVAVVTLLLNTWFMPAALALACGETLTRSVTLTEDLLDCPDVGLRVDYRNDVVIDLNGHQMTGAKGSSAGVMIVGSKGSKVIGGRIEGFETGIAANYSRNLSIENMQIDGVGEGIYWLEVFASEVSHSTFSNNFSGISMDGSGASSRNEVRYNHFIDNVQGVFLSQTDDNRVSGNTFRSNTSALGLVGASGNTVTGNGIFDNANGIGIQADSSGAGANSNRIEGNKLYDNTIGMILHGPAASANWNKYNQVVRNAFRGGRSGLEVSGRRNYRTMVSDNSFYDQSASAIDDTGTATTLSGNRCGPGLNGC